MLIDQNPALRNWKRWPNVEQFAAAADGRNDDSEWMEASETSTGNSSAVPSVIEPARRTCSRLDVSVVITPRATQSDPE